MAIRGDNTASFAFVDQAKYWLEKSYPNWREIYNGSPDQKLETLCIPDALDVLPNRRLETHHYLATELALQENAAALPEMNEKYQREKQAFRRDMEGQTGENKFFHAFRQLKLGGILISGFNTEEFITKMNREKVSNFDYAEWKQQKRHFECDAMFFHHQLGAFIIETKGCESRKVKKRFNEAANQLNRRIPGMKEIYRQITGAVCPFNLCGVICFPNANVNLKHDTYKVLGTSEFEGELFRQFWFPINAILQQCPINDTMISFIATIIGYRSAKFASVHLNALEIYRIIEQQDFLRENKTNKQSRPRDDVKLQSIQPASIILNNEQLSAVECREHKIIISGPPGTGKTVILLLRALEAAKLDKPGRVFVISGFHYGLSGNTLRSLFRKFVAENRTDTLKREIIADLCDDKMSYGVDPFLPEDDIFLDEMTLTLGEFSPFLDKYPNWRRTATGSTIIVITGTVNPAIADSETALSYSYFPNFHHIELKMVMRGTLSIINEWRHLLPLDRFVIPGHNVKGAPVERITINSESQIMIVIEEKVTHLLNVNMTNYDMRDNLLLDFAIKSQHLAIFTHAAGIYKNIIKHLTDKGLPCGSFSEQVNDKNLIAVGPLTLALSYDWPVVIYYRGWSQIIKSDDLIAMSRCISKLIIIESGANDVS